MLHHISFKKKVTTQTIEEKHPSTKDTTGEKFKKLKNYLAPFLFSAAE